MSEWAPGMDPGPAHEPRHAHESPYEPPQESVEFDREIQYHQLIWMGVGLLLIAVVSAVLVFFMLRGFVSWRSEAAGAGPVMPPPAASDAPQLLARPERELATVRSGEAERLGSYGWVDPASGVAHIPIERAIDLVAAKGLPTSAPTAAATEAPGTAPAPAPAAPAATPPATAPPPPAGAGAHPGGFR